MFKVAPADQAPADHHFDQQIEQLERDRALRNPTPRHLLFPEFGPGPRINHIREMVNVSFSLHFCRRGAFACFSLPRAAEPDRGGAWRSEEHPSELQSLTRSSYAGRCLQKTQLKQTTHC